MTDRKLVAVSILYFAAVAWMTWTLIVEEDQDVRRAHRLHVRYRATQRVAEYVGRKGLELEAEYHKAVERMRVV